MLDNIAFKLIERICEDKIFNVLKTVTKPDDRLPVWKATMEDNLLSELVFPGFERIFQTMFEITGE